MNKLLIALAALSLLACGNNTGESAPPATPEAPVVATEPPADDASPAETAGGVVKAPGEANVGDTSTCPVSGEEFVIEASTPRVEHEGKTYFLCCPGCKKKFEANPGQFLTKS